MLDAGAQRVIVGSALVWHGELDGHDEVDTDFAALLASTIGRERVVCAVDTRRGRVATEGWRGRTSLDPLRMMRTAGAVV